MVHTAVALGHALGADEVVVLSVESIGGHRAVAGYAIQVGSQSKTFAAVQIEPVAPSAETLINLAALLAGDKGAAVPGIILEEPDREPGSPAPSADDHHGSHTAAFVVGTIGVASLLGGGGFELASRSTYAQSKTEPDLAKQRTLYDSANLKYKLAQGFAAGGVVLVAAAAVLWIEARSPEDPPRVTIVPSATSDSVGFAALGRF
jgi:hypothetical protein